MSDEKIPNDQRISIGDEAARLLKDKLFNSVVNTVVRDYMADLMANSPGSEKGLIAHAGLRALDDIKNRLKALENDAVMARKDIDKGKH